MDQFLPGPGNVDQRIAAGGHLPQPGADDDQQGGRFDALGELGVDADTDMAGVVGVAVVHQGLAAEGTADREPVGFGVFSERCAGIFVPAAAAGDHEGSTGLLQHLAQLGQGFGGRPGASDPIGAGIGDIAHLRQHVFGQRQDHGARTPRQRGMEGVADIFGNAGGIVDLGDPFCHR